MSEKESSAAAENKKGIDRRSFIKGAGIAAASFYFFPRHVLGGPGFIAPSDTFNVAGIGVGGRGAQVLKDLTVENKISTQKIVALCDVDFKHAAKTFATYPNAKTFKDYRIMFDKMRRDIDGVMIATPDHNHAIIAMEAMRRKKHVYCEKPLTYTVHEARTLAETARKYKVVTQMGNQGHSSEDARRINEWIADGAIGNVSTVYAWTNRPVAFWPQGVPRPKETMAVPDTLDWDLFLGPAPKREYHPIYHPFNWRGFTDFGMGALGDMGAHLIDHPNWALKLGAPVSVEASCSPYGGTKEDPNVTYPIATQVIYKFAARDNMPPVTLIWNDGGLMPARPEELEETTPMDRGGGVLMIGDKGKLMHGTYGSKPRLLPISRMNEYKEPAKTIARIEGNHAIDWARCAKNGKIQPSSNFDYAGPLTETMLIGVIATRFPGRKLLWDSASMKFTNAPEANQFVTREYRQGFSLNG